MNIRDLPTGWQVRNNINPQYVKAVKLFSKKKAKEYRTAVRNGDIKAATEAITQCISVKNYMKKAVENAEFIVFDETGKCRFVLKEECKKEIKCFEVE